MKTQTATVIMLAMITASGAEAVSYKIYPDRELTSRADAVVIGVAGGSTSVFDPVIGPAVLTRLQVLDTLVDHPDLDSSIIIREPGNRTDGRTLILDGVPSFGQGEKYLIFLKRTPDGAWASLDLALGTFRFVRDANGNDFLTRMLPDEEQASDSPASKRRSADGFVRYVRELAIGASPIPGYLMDFHAAPSTEISASGSPVTGQAFSRLASPTPEAAPTPSSYTFKLSQVNDYGARWPGFSSTKQFISQYSMPNLASGGATQIQAAMDHWNDDCASSVKYAFSGIQPGTPQAGLSAADGLLSVRWEIDLSSYGASPYSCSSGGVLGLGGISSTSGTHTFSGETYFTTQEVDVDMNEGLAACTATASFLDIVQSALVHELGHTLGFRHSDQDRDNDPASVCSDVPGLECSNLAIMRSSVPNGLNGALQSWDIHAVRALYPGGSCSVARADFDNDGNNDLVWRNNSTGQNTVWFMDGHVRIGGSSLMNVTDLTWELAGTADFDKDGDADLVWRNTSTGKNAIWFMDGATRTSVSYFNTVTDQNWKIKSVNDFDGDGYPDLIWRNIATGDNVIWYMQGATRVSGASLKKLGDLTWELAGTADFNGDGTQDLIWRRTTNGKNGIWLMDGLDLGSVVYLPQVSSSAWKIQGVADMDSDGDPDLIWRNTSSGENAVWYLNDTTYAGAQFSTPVTDQNWQIMGPS